MRLLLSMGLKPEGRVQAPLQPRLRCLDTDSGEVTDLLCYITPSDLHPGPSEHAEFTGATLAGELLWQCTRTEVLGIHLPTLQIRHHLTHPLLHDVHHAVPTSRGIAVASTGNDSIVELALDGSLLDHQWLREGSFTDAFGAVKDFRTLPFAATKPRKHHPNHLRMGPDGLWVTCLASSSCRHLDGRTLAFDGDPHDGRLLGDSLWFTTTDGRVHRIDPETQQTREVYDIPSLEGRPGLAGWCRALERVGEDLFVGMTMLRSSPQRELLRRALRGRAGAKLPTRVLRLHLPTHRLTGSWSVGNHAGGTLYSIIASRV